VTGATTGAATRSGHVPATFPNAYGPDPKQGDDPQYAAPRPSY